MTRFAIFNLSTVLIGLKFKTAVNGSNELSIDFDFLNIESGDAEGNQVKILVLETPNFVAGRTAARSSASK